MDFEDVIKNRYSVRDFNNKLLSNEDINYIFDCARLAPSAKNIQPYKAYLLTDSKIINELKETTKSLYNAPNLLVITGLKNKAWINKRRGEKSICDIDVGIFATYIMLAAWNRGIGSCIVGMFDDKDLAKFINLSDEEEFSLLIILGYISNKAVPSQKFHFSKKQINDLLVIK
jgi:nitroreductase